MRLVKKLINSVVTLVLVFILSTPSTIVFAAESVLGSYSINIKNIIPSSELDKETAIQSLAFVEGSDKKIGSEVYLTTRRYDTTFVIRCTVSGTQITGQDYIALVGFGHGESLEIIKENGKTYLWVGSAAYASAPDYYWSTKISCVEYIKPTSGKKGSYSVIGTYTVDKNGGIAKDTSPNGHNQYNPDRIYERVSIAFSTASICVREANSTESKYIYFNNIEGGLTNAKIENALLNTSPYVSTVSRSVDRVLSANVYSYQSHDIYNGYIYIAGGSEDGVAKINKLKASTGDYQTSLDISNTYNSKQLEMEGIKINSSYIFYMLKPYTGGSNFGDTKIYYIAIK